MRLRFLDCEIDTARHTLAIDGKAVHVEPQVFDLIVLLAQNPGRLVTRDELVERIWQGRVVATATVDARVAAARKVIGDDGRDQRVIRTVARRGVRFVPNVECVPDHGGEPSAPRSCASLANAASGSACGGGRASRSSGIRFTRAADGTRLGFAASGTGPPLLRAGHWLTHLEHDRQSPIWRPVIEAFGSFSTFVRYDQRGNGLSDRGVADLSLTHFVSDLEAVADAAGLERFSIYATSQGGPIALRFAADHPQRVKALVLHGGFVRGRLVRSPEARAEAEAYMTLMRTGWGAEGSQFLQAFASIYVPDGTTDQIRSLVDLQRISVTAETAVALRRAFDEIDVEDVLPRVEAPALVVHSRNDAVHPLSESLLIADARLLVLESRDHVLVEHEPAWPLFFAEIEGFLCEVFPVG